MNSQFPSQTRFMFFQAIDIGITLLVGFSCFSIGVFPCSIWIETMIVYSLHFEDATVIVTAFVSKRSILEGLPDVNRSISIKMIFAIQEKYCFTIKTIWNNNICTFHETIKLSFINLVSIWSWNQETAWSNPWLIWRACILQPF